MSEIKLNERSIKEELSIMLKKFADYCDEHDLAYFLEGGTLLGGGAPQGIYPLAIR